MVKKFLTQHRWTLSRRCVQVGIWLLFFGTAQYGWSFLDQRLLSGTLSQSSLLGVLPLAEPFAFIQRLLAGTLPTLTALTGFFVVNLIYLALGPRVFCGWICPMNPVTEFAQWTRQQLHLTNDFIKLPKQVRWLLFGAILLTCLLTGHAAFEAINPQALLWRSLIFGSLLSAISAALGIFLLDTFITRNGWCGHLCPLGTYWILLGKLKTPALLRVHFEKEKCNRCGECIRICPERQIINFKELEHTARIQHSECLHCGKCMEVCSTHAFSFRPAKPLKKTN